MSDVIGKRYSKLLEIAQITTSTRRRELLNEITEMFFSSEGVSESENHLFGEVLTKIASALGQEVRRELSEKFSKGNAPRELAISLANDEIDIAYPIIRTSCSLTDTDLIQIAADKSTKYQLAITERHLVSEEVSSALVQHGDDTVVASLLRNEGASIDDATYGKVVERAENNQDLHAPMVNRKNIPIEYLNQIYLVVEQQLRDEIMDRNAKISPLELETAMKRASKNISFKRGNVPEDYEKYKRRVAIMKANGNLNAKDLPNIWRNGEYTLFRLAFAEICGLDYTTIDNMIKKQDMDGLAILCRAKDFDRGLFVALAVFVLGDSGMSNAEKLGKMYNSVPVETAGRALRFMQVRRNVETNSI